MRHNTTAVREAGIKQGEGLVPGESGVFSNTPLSFAERQMGTSPEELLAAAHASGHSMALSTVPGESSLTPKRIDTTAIATVESDNGDFTISNAHLDVHARIPGADREAFQPRDHAGHASGDVAVVAQSQCGSASFAVRTHRTRHDDSAAEKLSTLPGAEYGFDTNPKVPDEDVLLAYASETGFIDDVAEITRCDLEAAGISVRLIELGELDIQMLRRTAPMLFMTSTTGDGDAPFSAEPFSDTAMAEPAHLPHLRFGLLCAGDLGYENFCGFGHRLRDWLRASGACSLFEAIDVDCEDDQTIEHWRRCITQTFPIAEARLI